MKSSRFVVVTSAIASLLLCPVGSRIAQATQERVAVLGALDVVSGSPGVSDQCVFPGPFDPCASTNGHVEQDLVNEVDNSSCTFSVDVDWGDGTHTNGVEVAGGPKDSRTFVADHTYPADFASRVAPIHATGSVVVGACSIISANHAFRMLCPQDQLSGPQWAPKFPGSKSIADLKGDFRTHVQQFIGAMNAAGITVTVIATYRPPQRAYLMHWSYLVAYKGYLPWDVPGFFAGAGQAPVKICWVHTDASGLSDVAASQVAASDLAHALGIDPTLAVAPALHSRHTVGRAIDMRTTWTAAHITIVNQFGSPIPIDTTPHNGLNATLEGVGATYFVDHFYPAAADRNHWSDTGT